MENAEAEVRTADAEQPACSRCGAKLDFAPGTSALLCPYCGYKQPILQPQAQAVEHDYRSFLEKAGIEKESSQPHRIKCEQCGAQTTLPAESAAAICPFCGANMVFAGEVSRLIKPDALLPFKISAKQAHECFRRWIQSLWLAPNSLKKYFQADGGLSGVYIPFWTYDCDTTTSYIGERGDYYYTTENAPVIVNGRSTLRPRRVRHTRWSRAGGLVQNSFDDILILASKSLARDYADRLEPWDLANLVPYADEYLSGFRAEAYQISISQGFEAARQVMALGIENSIRRDIGGDEQRIHSTQTQYGKISFKHILLPVWLSAYRYRDKIYRILINARTGEVQGDRAYSYWKIAGLVLFGLLLLGMLILFGSSK